MQSTLTLEVPMARSFYTVSFLHRDGTAHVSRFFQTVRAARTWAARLAAASYVAEVTIYRGPAGGELVERRAA